MRGPYWWERVLYWVKCHTGRHWFVDGKCAYCDQRKVEQ